MISNEGLEKALEDIEELKKTVNSLTEDLLVDTSELKAQILELSREVAGLRLNEQHSYLNGILTFNKAPRALLNQASTDATRLSEEIKHSNNPNECVTEFISTWRDKLDKHNYNYTAQ
ncbi:SMC domain-containing protein [Dehalogenimonas lykanthroporepellens BL-DC-9]|nr:SMC domain-containing protein [Dehalogenimonas lykanthroporepellens BL-DC-9]